VSELVFCDAGSTYGGDIKYGEGECENEGFLYSAQCKWCNANGARRK